MSGKPPLLFNYLSPTSPALLGPVQTCPKLKASALSLVNCGLQTITLTEATFDKDHKPKTRTAKESISTSQPKGHAPLSIKFAMTAPAEGGRLSGKKVDLTCAGIGPVGKDFLSPLAAGKPGVVFDHLFELRLIAAETGKALNYRHLAQGRRHRSGRVDDQSAHKRICFHRQITRRV